MRQQNFQFVFPAPKHQQTGADSTSLRFSIFTHPSFCTGNALGAFCKSCARFVFAAQRSEEHTSELQSQSNLVCRLLLEKNKREPRAALTAAHTLLRAPPGPDQAAHARLCELALATRVARHLLNDAETCAHAPARTPHH